MAVTGLPIKCRMCGHDFPDNDAVWAHECPAWEAEVRNSKPRLAVYTNIAKWFEEARVRQPWRDRLFRWGMKVTFPDDPDADITDALGRLGPRHARRLEAKLIKRGLVKDRKQNDLARLRKQLDQQGEAELEEQIAIIVAESKARRRRERK